MLFCFFRPQAGQMNLLKIETAGIFSQAEGYYSSFVYELFSLLLILD